MEEYIDQVGQCGLCDREVTESDNMAGFVKYLPYEFLCERCCECDQGHDHDSSSDLEWIDEAGIIWCNHCVGEEEAEYEAKLSHADFLIDEAKECAMLERP